MTKKRGLLPSEPLTSSADAWAQISHDGTNTLLTGQAASSEWTSTQAGTATNNSLWIDTSKLGTQTVYAPNPSLGTSTSATQVGEVMTLFKTGNGEFVLQGANAQALLMEYFLTAPEMWLRLAASQPEKDDDETGTE